MISRLAGILAAKGLDRIELLTSGGVGYELLIPLDVLESLPRVGEAVSLHTALVVKEDGWQLFGFATPHDRARGVHTAPTARSAPLPMHPTGDGGFELIVELWMGNRRAFRWASALGSSSRVVKRWLML